MTDQAEQIDGIFSDLNQTGSPGATCAVVKDGEVIHTASFGEASIEHSVPNRENTIFYIASTSKQFAACSIALLEADGALTLDDDIREYIPELKGFSETIRVHHLVHHTSGIRDKYALGAIGGLAEESYTTDAGTLRLLGAQKTLNFPPGSRYMYSNSGYFLIAQIVERISGEPLREFTQKRIFGPAGMNDTVFREDPGLIIKNKASGYQRRQEGGWRLAEYTWQSLGPGGVFTTVGDLAKWDAALYGGVLEPSNLHEMMLRTRPFTDGKPNNYAFGLTLGKHRGLETVSHGGGVSGYSAEFLRYSEQRLTVICLANTSAAGSGMRARKIAELYLSDQMESRPHSTPSDEKRQPEIAFDAKFAGLYVSLDQTSLAEVRVEEGAVSIKASGQNIPLTPIDPNRVSSPMGFEILFDEESFTLQSPESDEERRRYARLTPPIELEKELLGLAGVYRSDELSREIEIKQESDGWTIARDHEKAQPLRYLGNDLFSWPVRGLSMEFELPVALVRDSEGKPVALKISMDRALGNLFHRM